MNSYTCAISSSFHEYMLIFFVGAFPVPLATICLSYIIIYYIAR